MTDCADKGKLIIVQGDFTGYGDVNWLTIHPTSEVWDLSTMHATFELNGITKTFDDLTQPFSINYEAAQTASMPLGDIDGVLRFFDADNKPVTVDNLIPVKVVKYVHNDAIKTSNFELNLEVKQGDEVVMDILVEAGVSVEAGDTYTVAPDDPARVVNRGTANHLILDFYVPKGDKGDKGDDGKDGADGKDGKDGKDGADGQSATIQVGDTTTGEPGTSASVVNRGTNMAAIFDFIIPKGEKGDQGIPGSTMEAVVVQSLPSTGDTGKLYLVPTEDPQTQNIYDEYIWAKQSNDTYNWEKIGTTDIDLSGYLTDATVDGTSVVNNGVVIIPIAAQNGTYGLIKLRSSAYGLGVDSSGFTIINRATTTDIDERTAYYKPLTPVNLDYATIISLCSNANVLDATGSEWTTARQFASRKWLGAMGSNIYGTSTTAASTVQKEVSIPSITELNAGQIIIVTPTVTSTVADSTLKLNNFPAYPMLYGGNAITTSTDSYVWIKDVPGWWLFDGSNWLFAGHGTDINTTYSTATVANIIAGTETTGRLVRSDYLKNGIFGVVTSYSSGGTITPSDKYLYNSTSNISSLTIAAPSSPDVRYMSQINMSSGSTATTLTYPSTFKVLEGCDDVQYVAGVRTFVPVANKRYQIFIENDGVNTVMFAKGV